jgi:peptidoglycan/LPS O-acetylase OafA/YrhL
VTSESTPRLAYRPELDGVRAVAVLAVMGYHLSGTAPFLNHFFRGGFFGIDVFFVLSGMLITELLVNEHLRHGSASLRAFYRRRSRRLLPGLLAFLVVAIGYEQLAHGTGFVTINGLGSVVSFVTAGHARSTPFPPGVQQVWTLVIEWEFYLVWPVVLIALLRVGLPVWTIGCAAFAGAVAVGLVRRWMFLSSGDYILSHYLAWLRADQLLVGCAIGLLGARPQAPRWLRTVAFGAVLYVLTRATSAQHWWYLGGSVGLAIATAAIVQPRTKPWLIDRVLASRPLVWTGKVSYSLYLWNGLLASVVGREPSWPLAVRVAGFLLGSFGLAAASYYLVERRFRLPSRRSLSVSESGPPSRVPIT